MQIPFEDPERNRERTHSGREEGKESNQQAFLQIGPQRARINFRACKERQQHASNACQEIDPFIGTEMEKIARQDSHADLDQGHGNANPNRNHGGDQRQPDPEGSN
jgi:hypothetical protein